MLGSRRSDVTGVVLAGGRGSRMGGVDKGLLPFAGEPLARRALARLAPQVGTLALSANRNMAAYAAWGVPVWPDAQDEAHAGPLAGLARAMKMAATPWIATVPCDGPFFPLDLVARLAAACEAHGAPLAMAETASGPPPEPARLQPVYCLARVALLPSLRAYLADGGRRVGEWARAHGVATAAFGAPDDAAHAFANANTPDELAALERLALSQPR